MKRNRYQIIEKSFGLKSCIDCDSILGKRKYYDRDVCAVCNICYIVYYMISNNGEKPNAFSRND